MTTIKTVEEVANEIWNAGSKLTHNDLDKILITDRATTLTALCEALEGMKKDEPPHAGYTAVEASMYAYAKGYNQALDDAIALIRTTLTQNSNREV